MTQTQTNNADKQNETPAFRERSSPTRTQNGIEERRQPSSTKNFGTKNKCIKKNTYGEISWGPAQEARGTEEE